MPDDPPPIESIHAARVIISVNDSVTTDHISPAGAIKADSPAGCSCRKRSHSREFQSYGSRRGNDRVMTRGTFANIRLPGNPMAPGTQGA
ncbi:MAG: hypothetical protein Ct9H300mP1_38240 [Planctomycetaceae bacterium]|nr:MAG: hypothetical protein Ct9H300mP1_38240 [Planctomycetaceae bacterium]